jgi:hypothetical protein
MQAQEYAMAKWAIGLRLSGINDADVEKAFNDGKILRTHVMRPTWHFVAPKDIRWLLALTAPRVHAVNAYMYRKEKLDSTIFKRCNDTLIKTLEGGKHLTREELKAALERKKIIADGFRLSYLMMQAELEGIICSGARRGKHFTYALLNERVPPVKTFNREEALAEFIKRYFTSRGPATLNDFSYWSGSTLKDVKQGFEMVKTDFVIENIDNHQYIFAPIELKKKARQSTFLMPDYDEYGMSYKNRSALFNVKYLGKKLEHNRMIIINGLIEGSWQRTVKNKTVAVKIVPFNSLNKTKQMEVEKAVKRYKEFMNSE